MKKIEMWEARDGEKFSYKESCAMHEELLDGIDRANAVLDSGGNLLEALEAGGFYWYTIPEEDKAILRMITKETKLVISYWQCKDTPGYSIVRFTGRDAIYTGGDAGAWSGPYYNKITVRDAIRYMIDTLKEQEKEDRFYRGQ